MTKLIFAIVIIAALSAGFFFQEYTSEDHRVDQDLQATMLSPPRKLYPFTLTDHNEQPLTVESLKGQWTMMFFGYTFCPDVCPTTLSVLRQAMPEIEKLGGTKPQVVFVSVDPERDTLQKLKDYVGYFDKDFLGATGDDKTLLGVTRQMGILYAKSPVEQQDDQENEFYLVDHSATIVLINPDGQLQAFFGLPHTPQKIAADYVAMTK